ncbi:MAG: AraC family transcriptional regulator [Microbacteriaceae bacterium]|jgi:AraC family transcriptional activator of tynA and feaB|nr:AraC family transcriptional regulator [Microbacteriaceae bacterium]
MGNSASQDPMLDASTTGYASREQFDYFCDVLCDVYLGIRPHRTTTADFDADVLAYRWGDVVLSRIRAPGHDARRDGRMISDKPDDALFLNFSGNAASTVEVGGRVGVVRASTPVLLDNARPFHLSFDPSRRFHLYSLRLPRVIGGRHVDASAVATVNERMPRSRVGRQLALQTRLMTAELDAGRTEVAGAMSGAVTALIAVLLEASDADGVDRLSNYKATTSTHLERADFTVHEVARLHRVSVRTVQAAFAGSGETFTAWIAGERLDLARDRLSDPVWACRSIERIAQACGIRDASGFHRAFRARFGESPGAFRP